MQHQPKPEARPLFADPNHEPLKVVDMASFHPLRGGALDVTLCTLVSTAFDDDRTLREPVVAARLRLDIGMARAIIEGLSRQVAMAEAANAVKN